MTTREQAMQWWNSFEASTRESLCATYFKVRQFNTLTGSEIETMYKVNQNIYLNRLKEQYKETKKEESNLIKTLRVSNYTGMRNFCLDCELLSFNDIELMENEVNSSFS